MSDLLIGLMARETAARKAEVAEAAAIRYRMVRDAKLRAAADRHGRRSRHPA